MKLTLQFGPFSPFCQVRTGVENVDQDHSHPRMRKCAPETGAHGCIRNWLSSLPYCHTFDGMLHPVSSPSDNGSAQLSLESFSSFLVKQKKGFSCATSSIYSLALEPSALPCRLEVFPLLENKPFIIDTVVVRVPLQSIPGAKPCKGLHQLALRIYSSTSVVPLTTPVPQPRD